MYTNYSLLQTIQIISGDKKKAIMIIVRGSQQTRDPEPVLTSVGASFLTLDHQH